MVNTAISCTGPYCMFSLLHPGVMHSVSLHPGVMHSVPLHLWMKCNGMHHTCVTEGQAVHLYPVKCSFSLMCVFSGSCNYVGSSHQIWHVGIVVAFMWMQYCIWKMMSYRKEHSCSGELLNFGYPQFWNWIYT